MKKTKAVVDAFPPAWQKQKEILKKKFQILTDQDLDFDEARKTEMMGRLARKLAMTTRELQQIIDQDFVYEFKGQ